MRMMHVRVSVANCAFEFFCNGEQFHETEIYCEYLPVKAALLATSKTNIKCDMVNFFFKELVTFIP